MFLKKKKKLLIGIVLYLVAVLISSPININHSLQAATTNKSLSPGIIKQKYIVKDSKAIIPQIIDLQNGKVQIQINKEISKKIHTMLILKDAGSPTYFDADFKIVYYNKNLLVIRYTGYIGEKLSAHPAKFDTSFHIDLKTGKFYSLKDLFKSNINYKSDLTRIIKSNEKKYRYQNTETDQWNDFTLDDFLETWDYQDIEFNMQKKHLNLYFMGPFATGVASGYKIPYNDIISIINQNGALWKSFNASPECKLKVY